MLAVFLTLTRHLTFKKMKKKKHEKITKNEKKFKKTKNGDFLLTKCND